MFGIVAFRVDMGGYVKLMIDRLYSLGQYVPYQHHRVRLPVAAAAVAAAARRHCSNYRHNVCWQSWRRVDDCGGWAGCRSCADSGRIRSPTQIRRNFKICGLRKASWRKSYGRALAAGLKFCCVCFKSVVHSVIQDEFIWHRHIITPVTVLRSKNCDIKLGG